MNRAQFAAIPKDSPLGRVFETGGEVKESEMNELEWQDYPTEREKLELIKGMAEGLMGAVDLALMFPEEKRHRESIRNQIAMLIMIWEDRNEHTT